MPHNSPDASVNGISKNRMILSQPIKQQSARQVAINECNIASSSNQSQSGIRGYTQQTPEKLKSTQSIKCNKTTSSFTILEKNYFTNKMHTSTRQNYTQDESTNIINLLHKKSTCNTCYNRVFIRNPLPFLCQEQRFILFNSMLKN